MSALSLWQVTVSTRGFSSENTRRTRTSAFKPLLERELSAAETRLKNLTDTVAGGLGTDALLEAIERAQHVKKDLARRLAELDGAA